MAFFGKNYVGKHNFYQFLVFYFLTGRSRLDTKSNRSVGRKKIKKSRNLPGDVRYAQTVGFRLDSKFVRILRKSFFQKRNYRFINYDFKTPINFSRLSGLFFEFSETLFKKVIAILFSSKVIVNLSP